MMEFFQWLIDWYMVNMNYFTILILMALESTFIPVPSEIVIPPAAWKAAAGGLNIWLVILFSTLGAIIGALINYSLARWLGRTIVYSFAESKIGRLFLLNKHKVEHAEAYFVRHGRSSTFIGRLVPGVRHLISIPAGLAMMNIKQLVLYTALGSAIWHTVLTLLTVYIYNVSPTALQKETIDIKELAGLLSPYMHEISYVLLGLGAVFVVYLIIKYKKSKV
jgi:membrane protein DedA with SNARE-associated domain